MKKVLSHSFLGQRKDSSDWSSTAVQHQITINWNTCSHTKAAFKPYCEEAAPIVLNNSPINLSCYTARKNESKNDILNQTTMNCKYHNFLQPI